MESPTQTCWYCQTEKSVFWKPGYECGARVMRRHRFFYQIFQLLTIRCAERMWPTGNLETFCVFQINLTRFYASTVVVSASRIWLVKEAGELCRDDFVLTCCPQFLCCDLYNEADMCPPWTAIRKVTWECWHCVDSCHMECSRGAKVLTLWSVARQYQGWFSHSRVEYSYISTPG